MISAKFMAEIQSRRTWWSQNRLGTAASEREREKGQVADFNRKEEPAHPAVVVEISSSTIAFAVVAGTTGFETGRLPLMAALLRPL
ncbi:hypothetical protein V6N13_140380 [Hibiscus sabdariffa]